MNRNYIRNYVTLTDIAGDAINRDVFRNLFNEWCVNPPTITEQFNDVITTIGELYGDWYVGYKDKAITWGVLPSDLTEEEVDKIKEKFVRKFASVYKFTEEKYMVLLNLYGEHRNNILKRLDSSVSRELTHKVNDTPQNSGNFDAEEFTSIYEATNENTKTVNNPETLMTMLSEVEDKYMNVIGDWVKEFEHLFIVPGEM